MFIPKKTKIFDQLVDQASGIEEAAKTFNDLTQDWANLSRNCAKLETIENRCDKLVHAVTDEVEKSFILPLDREDVRELSEAMDDIVDNLEEVASLLRIYNVGASNQPLKDFAALMLQMSEQIYKGVKMVKDHKMFTKEFVSCYHSMHDLETQGDKLYRRTLQSLMNDKAKYAPAKNPLLVIKWKEVFDTLEDTLDRCEHIAIIFDQLKLKYR